MERPRPPETQRARLVVLVSGSGSNLQAVLDASASDRLPADVVAVVSDRGSAFGLERARRSGVEAVVVEPRPGEARGDYDARLAERVGGFDPDWIVLAGWMRLLSMRFLRDFSERVVNLHPALPGELPGTHAIERAWDEAVAGSRRRSGVMVHLVPDEGVDDGPVLATVEIPIDSSGTLEEFEETVHRAEHRLLVDTLISLCTDRSDPPPAPDRPPPSAPPEDTP